MTALRQRAVLATTVPVTLRTFHTGTVRALQRDGYDVTLVSSPGTDLDAAAAATSSTAVALFMARRPTPGSDVRALWSWVRMLRCIRPRLVVAGTPKCALLAMVAAALQRVDRRIYICGGLRLEGEAGWRRLVLVAMERITMAAATEVVVNSRSLLDEADRLVDKRKVRQTLPGSSHGVDSQHFQPRLVDPQLAADLGIRPGTSVIGFVGRLTHDKGIDTLITACRQLRQQGRDIHLLVVGPQDEPDSQLYVERLGETGIATSLVGVASDVRPYFALMTLHVLPSLREGFPNVVLEAAAMGVPTVTTTATGCRDAVLDGKTGRLFPVGNAAALAVLLAQLLVNDDERARLGGAARDWVVSEFQPDRIARQIVEPQPSDAL